MQHKCTYYKIDEETGQRVCVQCGELSPNQHGTNPKVIEDKSIVQHEDKASGVTYPTESIRVSKPVIHSKKGKGKR